MSTFIRDRGGIFDVTEMDVGPKGGGSGVRDRAGVGETFGAARGDQGAKVEYPAGEWLLAEGSEVVAAEDEKTALGRVDRDKTEQLSRLAYKPALDHPWRHPLKPGAVRVTSG